MIQRILLSLGLLLITTFAPSVTLASNPLFKLQIKDSKFFITTTKLNFTYVATIINLSSELTLTNPDADCTSIIDGKCVFGVSDTGAATIGISGPATHHHFSVCIHQNTPSCENFDIHFAYVSNRHVNVNGNTGLNQVSICPIINGVLSACTGVNPGTITYPNYALVNASGTLAYVVNARLGTLSQCTAHHGSFTSCDTINGPFNKPQMLALGPTGSVYVTNYANDSITLCATNTQTGAIDAAQCQESSALFAGPAGIAINKSGMTAYIANTQSNTVSVCPLQSAGPIDSCTEVNPGSTFSTPTTITLNADETVAYITNAGNNTVSVCTMTNRTLSSCQAQAVGTLNNPWGFALEKSGTVAYITNINNNTVSVCPIMNGVFGTCSVINDSTFGVVTGISLSS